MNICVTSVNKNRFAIESEGISYSETEIKEYIRSIISENLKIPDDIVKFYDVGKADNFVFGEKGKKLFILNDYTHTDEEDGKIASVSHGLIRQRMGGTILLKDEENNILAEYIGIYDNEECNMIVIYFNMLDNYDNIVELKEIIEKHSDIILEEMVKEQSWSNKEVQANLYKNIQEVVNTSMENEESEHRRNVDRQTERIASIKTDLTRAINALSYSMAHSNIDENIKQQRSKRIFDDLELIDKEEKVENILIEDNNIKIITKPLTIYASNGKKYYGGNYTITFGIRNSNIIITSNNKRQSWWTEFDPHPHVNGRDGRACFGNLESTIIELLAQKEYYALILSLIDFLETANVRDPAGEMVRNWDEI